MPFLADPCSSQLSTLGRRQPCSCRYFARRQEQPSTRCELRRHIIGRVAEHRVSNREVGKLELNSESGTLLRPIDEVIGTMDSRREKKTTRLEAGQRRQPQFLMPIP